MLPKKKSVYLGKRHNESNKLLGNIGKFIN